MKELKLPDLGEGLQEAEVVSWLVQEGDTVRADQPIVSVETAKAVVEVPSPVEGVLAKRHFEEGEIVEVGQVVASFEVAGEEADAPAEAAPEAPASDNGDTPPEAAEGPRKDSGTVAGALEESNEVVREDEASVGGKKHAGIKATPAVRALARKLDVDLEVVTPTGPNDTITRGDIERVHQILKEVEPITEVKGVRRAMCQAMGMARNEVMHATIMDDADISAWPEKPDITVRLIRSICAACKAEPSLNGWFFPKEMGRRLLKKVHLGLAVDTGDGLFVPKIEDAGNRTPEELRAAVNQLKDDVRSRSVPPEQLRGHTITLSNFGMIAGKYGNPVVIPPTMAIVAAGKIHKAVRVVDAQPAVRKLIPLSLSFDHRVITGGEASRWLGAMIADLEQPR